MSSLELSTGPSVDDDALPALDEAATNKCCINACASGGCVVVCKDAQTVLCQLLRNIVCLLTCKSVCSGIGWNVLICRVRP
jgi:hypothetical protein